MLSWTKCDTHLRLQSLIGDGVLMITNATEVSLAIVNFGDVLWSLLIQQHTGIKIICNKTQLYDQQRTFYFIFLRRFWAYGAIEKFIITARLTRLLLELDNNNKSGFKCLLCLYKFSYYN